MFKMWNRRWLPPFWEKQIGGGWGRCMACKCMEGFLGDEVWDLDMDGSVFVCWYELDWDDNAVFVLIGKGGKSQGRILLFAAVRSGCGRVRELQWVKCGSRGRCTGYIRVEAWRSPRRCGVGSETRLIVMCHTVA